MRYSKSNLLAIALIALSTVEFSAVANAQNSKQDFPWRSKTNRTAAVEAVKSSLVTPERDLTTIETIATPTPSYESMPSVIYDEGKKYVRQGDTYVESPNVTAASADGNYASHMPAATHMPAVKKSSLFQKTKDLTGRLNPFSKSLRSPNAYGASDWKIPSFSNTLPSFSKKNDDPITFAAVTPLPAKTSVPASLDDVQPMLASSKPDKAPAVALPARDSQFKSALPTETKLTSVFPTETSITSVFPAKSKSTSVLPAKSKSISALPAKSKTVTSSVSKPISGFTANQSYTADVLPKTSQDVSVFQATPVKRPVATAAKRPVATPVKRIAVTPTKRIVAASAKRIVAASAKRPVRTSSLSADHEFWSPQR